MECKARARIGDVACEVCSVKCAMQIVECGVVSGNGGV